MCSSISTMCVLLGLMVSVPVVSNFLFVFNKITFSLISFLVSLFVYSTWFLLLIFFCLHLSRSKTCPCLLNTWKTILQSWKWNSKIHHGLQFFFSILLSCTFHCPAFSSSLTGNSKWDAVLSQFWCPCEQLCMLAVVTFRFLWSSSSKRSALSEAWSWRSGMTLAS